MSDAAILTEGLSKSFGAQAAVSELNLRIQPGTVYGFLGRNGAGKTTTMRMLLGLVRPTKGRARVPGLDPVMVDEILRTLIEDHVSQGRTIFVSSHHMGEVEQICDWVGILEGGRLLLESRLEEIRQEFRLVIASGEGLPVAAATDVVSATTDGRFRRYVVAREAERFAAELRGQGATILEISPLGLRELFLHLVRKEDPCTPGNAGAKPAPVSSFS